VGTPRTAPGPAPQSCSWQAGQRWPHSVRRRAAPRRAPAQRLPPCAALNAAHGAAQVCRTEWTLHISSDGQIAYVAKTHILPEGMLSGGAVPPESLLTQQHGAPPTARSASHHALCTVLARCSSSSSRRRAEPPHPTSQQTACPTHGTRPRERRWAPACPGSAVSMQVG